jgi:hypothetical protein
MFVGTGGYIESHIILRLNSATNIQFTSILHILFASFNPILCPHQVVVTHIGYSFRHKYRDFLGNIVECIGGTIELFFVYLNSSTKMNFLVHFLLRRIFGSHINIFYLVYLLFTCLLTSQSYYVCRCF